MPVAITPLGLGRTRRTDASPQVTINGTGFSGTPGQNQVFMGGSLATIVAESTTQITFTLPAPFSLDLLIVRSIHAPVVVVNLDTGERSTDAWVWLQGTLEEVSDDVIDTAIPGPFELTAFPENPGRFEARDMQRLASLIESLINDLSDGNVLAHDGTKLAEPTGLKGSGGGQVLQVDVAEPTKLKWGFALDALLPFGGTISFPFTVGDLLAGSDALGAVPSFSAGVDNWALDDGTLDLITLRNRVSGGSLLDRVRVLVNGVQQYDSGAGLAATNYSQVISVAVSKGDTVRLEATKSGGGGIALVGGIRLLVD